MLERLAVVARWQPARDLDPSRELRRARDRHSGSGRARRCGGELLGAHHAAAGPRSPKSTVTTSPCPLLAVLAGSAAGALGGGLGGLVGDLALADPVLRLAVGEDLAEVATDRLGAHPGLVAVAQPLLGLRGERRAGRSCPGGGSPAPAWRAGRSAARPPRARCTGRRRSRRRRRRACARRSTAPSVRRTSRDPSRRGPHRRPRRRGRPPRPGGSRSAGRRDTHGGCRWGRTRPGSTGTAGASGRARPRSAAGSPTGRRCRRRPARRRTAGRCTAPWSSRGSRSRRARTAGGTGRPPRRVCVRAGSPWVCEWLDMSLL